MFDPAAEGSALGLFPLLLIVGAYLYFSYCQFTIANKLGHSDIAWWAWVPILGWFQLVKLAGKPGIWFLFFLVPFVNVFVMAYLWMEVAKARGSSAFMGFLCIIPVIQFISLGILAFGGSGGPNRVGPGQFEGNRAPEYGERVGHDNQQS